MKKYSKVVIRVLMLAAVLSTAIPVVALACDGGSGYTHDQHMGPSGHMGSGQMGMYGTQAPVQPDPNAGYVPVQPPVSGYSAPQDSVSHGQMMGQGGTSSDHSGHMGH